MYEDEAAAMDALRERWAGADGDPRCPSCDSDDVVLSTRPGEVTIYCGVCPTSASAEYRHFVP